MAGNWLKDRLRRLFSNLRGIDAVLLVNTDSVDPNFHYLTGFTSGIFEDSLLIAKRDGVYLFTYDLEYQTALDQKVGGMHVINIAKDVKSARAMLKRFIKGKRVGVNGAFIPLATYNHMRRRYKPKRFIDVSQGLIDARLIKDAGEVERIREAVRITKTAMKLIEKRCKRGMTERQLAAEFDFLQMSLGADSTSFDTIVCFGKNAAEPHHSPGNARLKKGDLVLIDAGAKVANYCSDITRTFVFAGKGDAKQRQMINIVAKAQKIAMSEAKPDRKWRLMHDAAAKYIDEVEDGMYKGRFITAVGHSLGIEVHDSPATTLFTNKLEAGMVVTDEPGIYIPGFGGVRIEDDILITRKGYKIL